MGKKKSGKKTPRQQNHNQNGHKQQKKDSIKVDSYENVTFLTSPMTCTITLIKIILDLLVATPMFILRHYIIFTILPALVAAFFDIDGPHAEYREIVTQISLFAGWWIGLGIASSVGLGTGLHTFVLYLGPYMAQVAMAANE